MVLGPGPSTILAPTGDFPSLYQGICLSSGIPAKLNLNIRPFLSSEAVEIPFEGAGPIAIDCTAHVAMYTDNARERQGALPAGS